MGSLSQTLVKLMSADPNESRELAGRELRALFEWTAKAASRPLPTAP